MVNIYVVSMPPILSCLGTPLFSFIHLRPLLISDLLSPISYLRSPLSALRSPVPIIRHSESPPSPGLYHPVLYDWMV